MAAKKSNAQKNVENREKYTAKNSAKVSDAYDQIRYGKRKVEDLVRGDRANPTSVYTPSTSANKSGSNAQWRGGDGPTEGRKRGQAKEPGAKVGSKKSQSDEEFVKSFLSDQKGDADARKAEAPKDWTGQVSNFFTDAGTTAAGAMALREKKRDELPDGIKEFAQGQDTVAKWVLDMASRPLYAVEGGISAGLDAADAAGERARKGEKVDPMSEYEPTRQKVVAGAWKGLTSTEDKDRKLTSDNIEHATDIVGKATDRGYVDDKNNVNPLLKGVAGFAGDLALDPLSYIPGAAIASKLGLAGKAGQKVTRLDKLGAGERVAEEAAPVAPTLAPKRAEAPVAAPPAVAPKRAVRGPGTGTADGIERTPAKPARALSEEIAAAAKAEEAIAPAPITPAQAKAAKAQSQKAAKEAAAIGKLTPASAARAAVAKAEPDAVLPEALTAKLSPAKAESVSKWITDNLSPKEAKAVTEAVVTPQNTPALTGGQWIKEALSDPERVIKIPGSFGGAGTGKTITAGRLRQGVLDKKPGAIDIAKKLHASYLNAFTTAKSEGRLINAHGEPVLKSAATKSESTVQNAVDSYRAAVETDRAAVESALGRNTVTALNRVSVPEKFEALVTDIKSILDGSMDLSSAAAKKPAARALLEHLGVQQEKRSVSDIASAVPAEIVETPKPKTRKPAAARPAEAAPVETNGTTKIVGATPEEQGLTIAQAALRAEGFTDDEIPRLTELLRSVIKQEIVDPLAGAMPHVTKGGTRRNAAEFGAGEGNTVRQWNTGSQLTTINKFIESDWFADFNRLNTTGKNVGRPQIGPVASARKVEGIRRVLKAVRSTLDNSGVPTTMGYGAERIPLGFDELLEILGKHGDAPRLWQNPGTALPATNLMDMVVYAARSDVVDPEELRKLLLNTDVRNPVAGKSIPNKLAGSGPVYWKGKAPVEKATIVDSIVENVMRSADDLKARVADNAAYLQKRGEAEVPVLADPVLKALSAAVDSGDMGALVNAMDRRPAALRAAQEETNALDTSREVAGRSVDAAVPDLVETSVRNAKAVARKVTVAGDATTPTARKVRGAEATRAAQKGFDDAADNAAADATPVSGELAGVEFNLGDKIDRAQLAGTLNKLAGPFLEKLKKDFGFESISEILKTQTLTRLYFSHTAKELNRANRMFKTDNLVAALNHVKEGTPAPERLVNEVELLRQQVGDVFDVTNEHALMNNKFFSSNANVEHLNSLLYKTDFAFDSEAAARASKSSGRSFSEELADQWKTWNVKDPLDFVWQMKDAMLKIQGQQSMAQNFHRIAADQRLVSRVPRAGYARVVDPEGKSVLAKYLDPDTFYHRDILVELNKLDNVLQETTQFSSKGLGPFVNNTIIPIQNMWKSGVTIWRPGHHVRNLVGDMALNYLAGVKNPRVYTDALRVMAAKGSYKDVDIIEALRSGGHVEPVSGGTSIMRGRIGKEDVDVTADMLYAAASNEGLYPTYHGLENLDEAGEAALSGRRPDTVMDVVQDKMQLTGGRAKAAVGTVSEYRDHTVRTAHFIDLVNKGLKSGQFKDLDQLFAHAGQQVRKWHPDGTHLSTFESKYLRRIMPFYSWTRGAIPLVIESALLHPGRVMAFPKAQYNLAVANGIDPNSLSDPFPDDQLFPQWMQDGTTGTSFESDGGFGLEAGHYYGINPGWPSVDISEMLLGGQLGGSPDVNKSVLNSLSPIIKAPIEKMTGTNIGLSDVLGDPDNPAKIRDQSDWLDNQIPGLSDINRITGISPTDILPKWAGGDGGEDAGLSEDAKRGNLSGVNGAALINWLTGLGLVDQSKPNYINQAEFEVKDRMKAAKDAK